MPISRSLVTPDELEDAAAADVVRSYIALRSRDWVRRERARVLPGVLRLLDEARARGDRPDVRALARQVFESNTLPELDNLSQELD